MSLRRMPVSFSPGRVTHRFYASQTTPVTIGIRREDPGRKWERRVPLTPDAVAELVGQDKVRVLIQECERRVFPVDEYIRVRTIRVHRYSELIAKYFTRQVRRCIRRSRLHILFSASKKHLSLRLLRAQSLQSNRIPWFLGRT